MSLWKTCCAPPDDMPLWEAVLTDDLRDRGGERDTSWEKMTRLWRAMVESVEGYDPARRSACNLTGGDARKVETRAVSLAGPVLTDIIATALKVGECNACMGRIVAAPTAGASGVLPAVLLPIRKKYDFSEEEMVKALYVSAGFGQVIATRASIAGAEGGCQAEIGSASAMARRCAGLPAGGLAGADGRRLRHRPPEPAGTGVRPGGRTGGGPLCQAKRHRRGQRPHRRGTGPGGSGERLPATRSSMPCAPWAT